MSKAEAVEQKLCHTHEKVHLPFLQPKICHGESATTSGDASFGSNDPIHPGKSDPSETGKRKTIWK